MTEDQAATERFAPFNFRPKIIDDMRALAMLRNDAELLERAGWFETAIREFFCEPSYMSASDFTRIYTHTARCWQDRTGEPQPAMAPEEFVRIRTAALALHRPRDAGVMTQ